MVELLVGITNCWMDGDARMPAMPLSITPLNATKDMKMASTITSAIDHLDSWNASSLTMRLLPSNDGRNKDAQSASIFSAGKTTLNRMTRTATRDIAGRCISIRDRETSST